MEWKEGMASVIFEYGIGSKGLKYISLIFLVASRVSLNRNYVSYWKQFVEQLL